MGTKLYLWPLSISIDSLFANLELDGSAIYKCICFVSAFVPPLLVIKSFPAFVLVFAAPFRGFSLFLSLLPFEFLGGFGTMCSWYAEDQ